MLNLHFPSRVGHILTESMKDLLRPFKAESYSRGIKGMMHHVVSKNGSLMHSTYVHVVHMHEMKLALYLLKIHSHHFFLLKMKMGVINH